MNEKLKKQKERAAAHLSAGELEAALDLYRQIGDAEPGELGCLVRAAEIARDLGRRAEAIGAFRRVAERFAADGLLLKAIAALKQILALEENNEEAQLLLAQLSERRAGLPLEAAPPTSISEASRRRRGVAPAATAGAEKLKELLSNRPARGRSLPVAPAWNARLSEPPGGIAGDLPPDAAPPPRIPPTPLFSALPRKAFIEILVDMKMRTAQPEEVVVTEGERGDSFFVLSSGRVRVEKRAADGGSMVLAYLTDGAFFGEMAIFQDGPRTASVIAEEESQILEIDRALLNSTAERYPSVAKVLRDFYKQRLLATTMQLHPFFAPFSPSERRNLVEMFRSRAFLFGETLIAEGGKGQGLYLLLSGRLQVSKEVGGKKVNLAELAPGDVFGEMSLLFEQPTVATVTAVEDAWVVRLAKNRFQELVRARPEVLEMLSKILEDRLDTNRALLSKEPAFSEDGAVLV